MKRLYLIAVAVAIVALALGFFGVVKSETTYCRLAQKQYDGQMVYTRFLAREFHASPAQTTQGLKDLRATLGKRPSC